MWFSSLRSFACFSAVFRKSFLDAMVAEVNDVKTMTSNGTGHTSPYELIKSNIGFTKHMKVEI